MATRKISALGAELVEAMQEVAAHARGEIDLPARIVRPPRLVDVAGIRHKLKLSQQRFADRFGFSVSAVREWEQGRRQPDRAARLLLLVIDRETEAVERALGEAGGEARETGRAATARNLKPKASASARLS